MDNLGKYPERTFSVPIQIGAKMDLGKRVKFRIGTSLHLTMSDLIDNVTEESEGNRAGTRGNDKFLFTSFALTYDLKLNRKKKEKMNTSGGLKTASRIQLMRTTMV